MNHFRILLLASLCTMIGFSQAPAPKPTSAAPPTSAETSVVGDDFYDAIVKIENHAQKPDYATPWNAGTIQSGSGTGFLIGTNRFLTNAHVVSNSRSIYLKKRNEPKPYKAKIVHIAHDCDLALLEVEDDTAFQDVKPLRLGGIPRLDTTVRAIGYPMGGKRMSITRGVVSRIDFNRYTHSYVDSHLAIQVDAAINPGNSGGPVVQNDKVVGVAFQGYSGSVAKNIDYMIPVPVIDRFLKDIEDGSYDHYVDLGVQTFNLLNPAQRRAMGLASYKDQGVMVAEASKGGSAGGTLRVGDVLLAIDGHPIASDGFITVNGGRVNMSEVVERKFRGDRVSLKILRGKKEQELEITTRNPATSCWRDCCSSRSTGTCMPRTRSTRCTCVTSTPISPPTRSMRKDPRSWC